MENEAMIDLIQSVCLYLTVRPITIDTTTLHTCTFNGTCNYEQQKQALHYGTNIRSNIRDIFHSHDEKWNLS